MFEQHLLAADIRSRDSSLNYKLAANCSNIQNFRIRLIASKTVLSAVTDGMVFELDAVVATISQMRLLVSSDCDSI